MQQVSSASDSGEGPRGPRPPVRRAVAVAAGLIVVAAAVAVTLMRDKGGRPQPKAGVVPTTAVVPTGPTASDPQNAVEAAVTRDYLAAEAAYDEAIGAPDGKGVNPDLPALVAHMTGKELAQIRTFILGMKGSGLTGVGPPAEFHPRVLSVQGPVATLEDCYTTNSHIVDANTHGLHDQPGPVTRGVKVTLEMDPPSGLWRISDVVTKDSACPARS